MNGNIYVVPSINDVTPEVREESTKNGIWVDFQGLNVMTKGRKVKKLENWGDIIYEWSPVKKRISQCFTKR